MQGDLANGEDVCVAGPQVIVNNDAATRPHVESARACQLIARTDPRRDYNHVDLQALAVGKRQALDTAIAEKLLRARAEVNLDAHTFDLLA